MHPTTTTTTTTITTAGADRDRGFLMVALLIAMAVVAIWMTAALPSWRQQAQREKEEELIFRGEQYAMAIALFQIKNRNALPPDIDTLVSQHLLRKKWKDPITGCDFVPQGPGQIQNLTNCPKYNKIGGTTAPIMAIPAGQQPGITGVRSLSQATSIKIYMQQQQHWMWPFDANRIRAEKLGAAQAPGAPQQGRPTDGRGRGGPGTGAPGAPGRGVGPGRGGDAGRAGGPPVPPPRPIGRGGGN